MTSSVCPVTISQAKENDENKNDDDNDATFAAALVEVFCKNELSATP